MTPTAENLLRLTHCPRCGYDLEGLPREHACPECGYAYDMTVSMIWVWSDGEEPKIFNVVSNGLSAAFLFLIFLMLLWAVPRNGGFGIWFFLIITGFGSFTTYKSLIKTIRNYRLQEEDKASDALVFSPSGFLVKREGAGQWKLWDKVKSCKLKKLRKGRWRLRLRISWWQITWKKEDKTFIFKATPREAAAIRSRIRWCIAEAKKNKRELDM